MKTIATLPLLALALTACDPYYNRAAALSAGAARLSAAGLPPYPAPGYPQGGPPMPPGGPVYPGPGQPTPARLSAHPAPYPIGETTYRAIGTEPFWDLEIGRDLIFTDRGNNVSVREPTPTPIHGIAGEIYRTSGWK